jgi:hypothetical protein
MERSDLPDKLFAEDTLPHPQSVDGERPTNDERHMAVPRGDASGIADEDMLAVEYREDEIGVAGDPLDHAPSPRGVYAPDAQRT